MFTITFTCYNTIALFVFLKNCYFPFCRLTMAARAEDCWELFRSFFLLSLMIRSQIKMDSKVAGPTGKSEANPIKILHLRTNLQTRPKACNNTMQQIFVCHNVRALLPNIFIELHFYFSLNWQFRHFILHCPKV